jgi:hypothetical protein
MAYDFPRLLVATEFPPNASGGGPAVVRQMLKHWPVEKLAWWSCLPEESRTFGQQVSAHSVAAIPRKLYPHLRWREQKSWLLENVWTPWATGHFRRTLTELGPEAVWVIPHQWSIPPLMQVLPSAAMANHVTMQDYMDAASCRARFGVASSRRMAAGADHLYRTAATRDATSHPMIADLAARTGAQAVQMLHAGLEQEDFDWLARDPGPRGPGAIRIAYAGTVLVEPEFALFVKVLADLRQDLPAQVTLELFSSHSYRERGWFNPEWIHERGNLPAPQLTEELRKCSWGFSPMALTDDNPRYNRFSFPTKFISYLAAGLPIITLGHAESSVVKMATAYNLGVCLEVADEPTLRSRLREALSEPEPGPKFRNAIQACARAEFDARRMRQTLYDCFRRARGGAEAKNKAVK